MGFSKDDTTRSNGAGGLVYKFDPGDGITLLNQSGFYDNYEVCAVFGTEAPPDANAYVSVAFWTSDKDNSYEADVYPIFGTYAVYRYQKKKFLKPISPTGDASIQKGTSATNEISVTVNGNKATLAINGKKVTDFTGQPPEDGSLFGFDIGTVKADTGPSTITLKDIQLCEIEAASNH